MGTNAASESRFGPLSIEVVREQFIDAGVTRLLGIGGFQPVVNERLMVVAHLGTVSGDSLIGPGLAENLRFFADGRAIDGVKGYLEAEFEVFILDGQTEAELAQMHRSSPEGWIRLGFTQSSYAVLVLPNGQVVHAELLSNNNGAASPSWSPVDFFSPGRVGVVLAGRYTGRILVQAARRGYRLLARPTLALAKRLEAKLAQRYMIAQVAAGANPKLVNAYVNTTPFLRKISGLPDATVSADGLREMAAANRFAMRSDVEQVWLGNAAKQKFNSPAGEKFPDVIARRRDGQYLAAEGKGTAMGKAVKQFEQAHVRLNAKGHSIIEHEVVVPSLKTVGPHGQPIHGVYGKTIVGSPGLGWGVNDRGYLVNMEGPAPLESAVGAGNSNQSHRSPMTISVAGANRATRHPPGSPPRMP